MQAPLPALASVVQSVVNGRQIAAEVATLKNKASVLFQSATVPRHKKIIYPTGRARVSHAAHKTTSNEGELWVIR